MYVMCLSSENVPGQSEHTTRTTVKRTTYNLGLSMSMTCYLDVIDMLFGCHQHVIWMSSTCYLDVTNMLFGCHQHSMAVIILFL